MTVWVPVQVVLRAALSEYLGLTDLMTGARLSSAVGEVPVVEAVENFAAADV